MLGAGSLLLFNVVCIYLCVVFHFKVVCHATWLGSVVREFYHSSLVWQLIYTTWSHFLVCQLKIVVTVVMLVCYANTIMLLGRSIL